MSDVELKLVQLLKDKYPDALAFIIKFNEACHRIDDIIDECKCESEFVMETFFLWTELLSSNFYASHRVYLYPSIVLIFNTYADSNKMMAKDQPDWKQKYGDALRFVGNDIVIQIVTLLCGWKSARELSILLREHSYIIHHDGNGNPQ